MNLRMTLFAVFCFLLSLSTGCEKLDFLNPKKAAKSAKVAAPAQVAAPVVKGTIVAKVNNIPISLEDLNLEIEAYNAMVPADKPEMKITTREQKLSYLKNEMVRRTLLYQQAMDKGLDRSSDVLKAMEKTRMELLVVELIKQEAQNVDVASKEVEDYYNLYKDQLREPEEREISEIMVPTEQEAKDVMIQLLQGADFATLARERSKSESAKNAGVLGVVQRGAKFAAFDSAVFSESLEVGKTSSIFKGPDGYYIVRLEAKRGGKLKSLTEMWDDIKRGLTFLKQQQKIEELIGKLSREAKLEFYEGEIK